MIRRTYGKNVSGARDTALTLEGSENPYSAAVSAAPSSTGIESAPGFRGQPQTRPSRPSRGVSMDLSTLKDSMKATEYATHKPSSARHTFASPTGKTARGESADFNSKFGGIGGTPGSSGVQSVSELLLAGQSAASVDDFEFALSGIDPGKSPASVPDAIKEFIALLETPSGRAVARARGYTASAMDKSLALVSSPGHRGNELTCFSIACVLALLASDSRSVTAFTKTGVQSLIELMKGYGSKTEGGSAPVKASHVPVPTKTAWVTKSSPVFTPGASSTAISGSSSFKTSLITLLNTAGSGASLPKETEGIDIVLAALSSLLQVQNSETTAESPSLEFMSRYVSQCKDWTRLYGGIPALCAVIEAAACQFSASSHPDPNHVRRFLSAALILENLTFLSAANQNAVCTSKPSTGVPILCAVLKVACLAGSAATDVSSSPDARSWVLDCLFGCLRLLINVTHDNIATCEAVSNATVAVADDTVLSGLGVISRLLLLASPRTAPLPPTTPSTRNFDGITDRSRSLLPDVAAASFDLLLLLAGLVTNLTEHSDAIRDALSTMDLSSLSLSSSSASASRKRPRDGTENALAAFAHVFLSSFSNLRMDVTGWVWPQDRSNGNCAATPAKPKSPEDAMGSPVFGDADLLTPKPRAPPQFLGPSTAPPENDSVSVEDIVASAHLSLMLGCCMRDNGFAQACVKRALPNGSLVPLGVVLNSFIKLQMDAGVLAETTILAMKCVLDELCDMDHSRVGVRATVPMASSESAVDQTLLLAASVPRKASKPAEPVVVEETPLFAPVKIDRRKLLGAVTTAALPKPATSTVRPPSALPIATSASPTPSVKPSLPANSLPTNQSPNRPARPAVVSPAKHTPEKSMSPVAKSTPLPTKFAALTPKPAFVMAALTASDDDGDDSDDDFVSPPKSQPPRAALSSVSSRASVRTYGGRK